MKYEMADLGGFDRETIPAAEEPGPFQRGMVSWAAGLWMSTRVVTCAESVNRHCGAKPQSCEGRQ
jgi:hypothetical protein